MTNPDGRLVSTIAIQVSDHDLFERKLDAPPRCLPIAKRDWRLSGFEHQRSVSKVDLGPRIGLVCTARLAGLGLPVQTRLGNGGDVAPTDYERRHVGSRGGASEVVLRCGRCGDDMRLLAMIEDPAVVEQILRHLRLWERGPSRSRHVVIESRDRDTPDVNY